MNREIVESFADMVKMKGIDKDVLAGILEEVFTLLVRKKYGEEARCDVVVNMDRGDIEIYLERQIVDEVIDPGTQISIEDVNKKGNEDDLDVGEDYVEKIALASLGRRLITLAKQSLNQKIREIEKDIVYNEYKELVGEIVVGDIYQIRKSDILINHNKNELMLPRDEQIPYEKYKKGETIRAIVKEVRKTGSGPQIIVSRADNMFLRRLFEIEIPEIYDGIIDIKGIAREPGERAKVAVESQDARIDAVGACVGMKGVRIHAIVRELNNENIDVVNYAEDPTLYIQRSLAPAKIKQVEVDEETKKAIVTADSDQVSLIVGRNGVNIRLAMKLTGFEIDVLREQKAFEEYEEDIELIDLKEELGEEVYTTLINNRYDTALEVLTAGAQKLMEIEGFDEEKANGIIELIKAQFEEEE
ncbi:MAG: transcription termination factor NusA [Ignavibacteriota bacterium]|nr:MAG: transcription termination factor NusA [Chlorobiota bacterium]MBE7476079.1 transcription termination factor NusA [Ignavibacteriales bacterium]MBL1124070.1 transcription termination factor NusA [Ignavibacteriota bacterium]MBV6420992.1 Transcription termination/antitermination protein NusA [Ignavibacteriaceae bacterium]MCE7856664.1 transcription termination factor NusA [Ignavibacteria bacterium CHB3]MEB2295329.1 transcription termination factor NusA [Ignavibacteria bacterium]